MDTRSKSSRKWRTLLAAAAVLAVTLVNFLLFPAIGIQAEKQFEELKTQEGVEVGFMQELIEGSYVLYYELAGGGDTFGPGVQEGIKGWQADFEGYRNRVDYYAMTVSEHTTNTSRNLSVLLGAGETDTSLLENLKSHYQCWFLFRYGGEGEFSIDQVWSENGLEDELVKTALQAKRTGDIAGAEGGYVQEDAWYSGFAPKDFQVVFGIPDTVNMASQKALRDNYEREVLSYMVSGDSALFLGSLTALALAAVLLNSNKIWKGTIAFQRRGRQYMMEPAIFGFVCTCSLKTQFTELNVEYGVLTGNENLFQILGVGTFAQVYGLLEIGLLLVLLYAMWYLSLYYLRPVFTLGPKKYIRQYSLVYLAATKGISWLQRRWNRLKDELAHVDFSRRTMKLIRRIVILNFLVLAVLSFFWFFGIFALVVYSVVLFFILKRQYDRVERDYRSLMEATAHIAQGELQYEDTSDWGMFEPFKQELAKIRSGFSKAVEEEVKSQRMKTELITNVSHDLKTPLTAITTYVELLKDPNLTPEQRAAYVEILDKKARRLKILVEDLFEVSKAASDTIKLDLMEVDVVNLLKQVWAEHEARFSQMGLLVKWTLPKEKVIRMLDNQKTYRIFENLFGNIEKYAMPGSRVYVEVRMLAGSRPVAAGTPERKAENPAVSAPERKAENVAAGTPSDGENAPVAVWENSGVEIVIKNMSAQELHVSGEEITKRFVRGDSSRSTEGSGLGLAIAKSFTKAQKGEFQVTVDGDLFKVMIRWR